MKNEITLNVSNQYETYKRIFGGKKSLLKWLRSEVELKHRESRQGWGLNPYGEIDKNIHSLSELACMNKHNFINLGLDQMLILLNGHGVEKYSI